MFTTSQQRLFRKIELDIFDAAAKYDVASKVDKEGNYIFTPWNLSGEMITSIISKVSNFSDKTFLVADTVEIIPVLLAFGINSSKITYVAPYAHKGIVAKGLGVNVVQESLLTWKTTMKFDIVIGNPPYLQGTWRTFMKRSLELSDLYVLLVSPDGTISTSVKQDMMETILKNGGIQSVHPCHDYFPGLITSSPIVWYFFDKTKLYAQSVFDKTLTDQEVLINRIIKKVKDKQIAVGGQPVGAAGGRFERKSIGDISSIESIKKVGAEIKDVPRNSVRIISDSENYVFVNHFFGMNTDDTVYECKGEVGVGKNVYHLKKPADYTAAEFKRVYLSKLMRFVLAHYRGTNQRTLGWTIAELPYVPYGEIDLYGYVNLTQDEIDYIEVTVK